MSVESNPYLVALVVFFFMTSFYLQSLVSSQLITQKVCYPYAPPGVQTLCHDDDALKKGNDMMMTRSMIRETIPALVVLWAGSWNDRTGYSKPLVMMAICGELVGAGFALISSQVWSLNPWVLTFGDGIIPGFTGSRHVITTITLPLVIENATEKQRPTRSMLMFIGILGGACVGQVSSGFILKHINYLGYSIVVLSLQSIAMVLAILFVKNIPKKKTEGGFLETMKRLGVVFQRRPNQLVIWCLLIPNFVIAALLLCEGTVSAAFNNKILNLTQDQVSLLNFYRLFIALVSSTILTPLLVNVLKISEFYIAIFSCVMCAASSFCMHFAKNLLQAYLFSTLDLMKIVVLSLLWTRVMKCIKKSETGMFASFLTVGEALMPLALNPLYNYVTKRTISTDPGAFYLLSGGIICCAGCFVIIAACRYVKVDEDSHKDTSAETGSPHNRHSLEGAS